MNMREHALRIQYRGITIIVQAFEYIAQYKLKAKAIKLLKSKLWAKKNDESEIRLFVYDLENPYPEDLIRHREKYGLDYDD